MTEPSMAEIAFRAAEMRGRFPGDERATLVGDAIDQWMDALDAFDALPWYRQAWEQLRGRLPRYRSPLR